MKSMKVDMESIMLWNQYEVEMESTWNRCGSRYGMDIESIWSEYGLRMESVKVSMELIWIRYQGQHGTNMEWI